MAAAIITLLSHRLTWMVPLLLIALLLGEPLGRLLGLPALRRRLSNRIVSYNTRLNRRSAATRVYRGIAVLLMLEIPAILLGLVLTLEHTSTQALAAFLGALLVGSGLEPYRLWRQWRAARRGSLTLQLENPPYVFADTFGVLRYEILRAGERFAVIFIGGSLYALLFGITGLLAYFTLAAAASFYAPHQPENKAFGWAAHALFQLLDAPPRLLSRALLWLAALFTPLARPFAALRHRPRSFHGWLAELLGLSLGGPMPHPSGETALPWAGHGTPKPTARDFTRALQLFLVASLTWILLLGSIITLLNTVFHS